MAKNKTYKQCIASLRELKRELREMKRSRTFTKAKLARAEKRCQRLEHELDDALQSLSAMLRRHPTFTAANPCQAWDDVVVILNGELDVIIGQALIKQIELLIAEMAAMMCHTQNP